MNALDRAIELVGGVSRLSELLGIRQSAVSNWRSRGTLILPEHCVAIESATGCIVRRWDLRPTDWHRIWPELIGLDGAPAVPDAAPDSQAGALDAAAAVEGA